MISSARSYSASVSIGRGSASARSCPYFRTSSFGLGFRLVATVIFPRSFVVFLVRQHEASQDPFPRVKNLRAELVIIAFDVENWKRNLSDTGLNILVGSLIVSGIMAFMAYYISKFIVVKYRKKTRKGKVSSVSVVN